MNKASCLTDKPIQTKEEDNLCAGDYADALCEFIEYADTPVTIGIQGGWGSGKTSLISVIQDKLAHSNNNVLCVLVNAWEHSLFQDNESKAEVTLSLLHGLAEGVKSSVQQAVNTNKIDDSARKAINENSLNVEKAIQGIKICVRLAAMIAAKTFAGADLAFSEKAEQNPQTSKSSLAKEVRNLRNSLTKLIENITYLGKQVKVVFFIDDLDRVSPPTAIEILDITKNIFDIPNCIFVLAIDYEVVVKGLEKKFGKRTAENEREFRQYFDKIIQIPFTMPIGAYGKYINKLLEPALKRLGVEDLDCLKSLSEDAMLVTGGNPRSIKRIVNTLSLLQYIDKKYHQPADTAKDEDINLDLEARFIIVGLHINFPEICRKIMEKPNFVQWKEEDLKIPWKLKMDEETNNELNALEKNEFFDDPWEKVIYRLCVQSSWLKSKVKNVSSLLNRLLVVLNNDEDKNSKIISENGMNKLNDILEGIRVVSIDSDTANIQEFDDSSYKTDRVTSFCKKWHENLRNIFPKIVPLPDSNNYAKKGRRYEFMLTDNKTEKWFSFLWKKSDEKIQILCWAKKPKNVTKLHANNQLSNFSNEYLYDWDGLFFYYYYEQENITFNDIHPENTELMQKLLDESKKLYKTVNDTVEKLITSTQI